MTGLGLPNMCSTLRRQREEEGTGMSERRSDVGREPILLSDEAEEKIRREQMSDPKVRARVREIFDDAASGDPEPGITAEELPDFLREHGD